MLGTVLWLLALLWATIIGSPIVYANRPAIRKCFELAELKESELVMDLGCGDSRTLILAASEFGAKGIGVDRSPLCQLKSSFNILISGQSKNVRFIRGDFKKAEQQIAKADVIYLYLLDSTLAEIENWLFETIGPKTRVVSLSFEFRAHEPAAEADTSALGRPTKARLYRK